MATLIFITPDGSQQEYELTGELSVGREAGNDIVLPEGGLSRKHARFFMQGAKAMVEDLGSSNGTMVEGKKIAGPTAIREGFEILLASVRVEFRGAAAKQGTPARQSPERRAAGNSAKTGQIAAVTKRPTAGAGAPARRPGSGAGGTESAGATGARGTLKGLTGPWAGKRFPLGKPVMVIGRVSSNDISVDDESVSRQHAEIRKSGEGYTVKDLDSANGTFVNDEPIREAALRPGDVVKFGVVEFTYSGPAGVAAKGGGAAAGGSKKKLLIGAGVGLFALIGIAVVAGSKPSSGGESGGVVIQQKGPVEPQVDVVALLGNCKSYGDYDGNSLDWVKSIKYCEQVLKEDPINAEAREQLAKSKREKEQQDLFDAAAKEAALGHDEQAITGFTKVASESVYFRPARAEVRRLAPAVMKRLGESCADFYRARQFERAWPKCKAFYSFFCFFPGANFTGVESVERAMRDVEKMNKGKDTLVCPQELERFLRQISAGSSEDLLKGLEAKYGNKDVAQAVLKYSENTIIGIQMIQSLSRNGKISAETFQSIFTEMQLFFSKRQQATPMIINPGQLMFAAPVVEEALAADSRLMPEGKHGKVAEQLRAEITERFADRGQMFLEQGRLPEAFAHCNRGSQIVQRVEVTKCLADIETAADKLLGGSCDDLKMVMKITRPTTIQYKTADRQSKENGCN